MNINQGIIASQFDYDALLFLNASGISNSTQRLAINYLTRSLKLNGLWNKLNAIYPFVGGSATSHKFNLINPADTDAAFRLSFLGGWTHSSNGALPNGTNAYADTFLNPFLILPLVNCSFGIYSRTNNISGQQIYGCFNGGTLTFQQNIVIFPGTQGNFTLGTVGVGVTYPINTLSLFIGSRTANNLLKAYRAGVSLGSNSGLSTSLPNLNFYFGARNSSGTANLFSVHELAFGFLGSGLTDAEALIFYNIVQAFQTTLGRQV